MESTPTSPSLFPRTVEAQRAPLTAIILSVPENVISLVFIITYSRVTASFDVLLTRVLLARFHLPHRVHLRGRKTCYEDLIWTYFWTLEAFNEKRVSTITVDRTMFELR